MSPRMREAVGKDPKAHNWKDYAARTASTAFGYKGDKEIEKYASYVKQWESIEGKTEPTQDTPTAHPTTPQKTEAQKPKPLSAEADKKRLEELRKLRDKAGQVYVDPIIEAAKQEKPAEIKAQRPAAEKSLADAEEALRMEIEERRGSTGQEVVAKHEGVRYVLEVIEKYRGREIDRGLGR